LFVFVNLGVTKEEVLQEVEKKNENLTIAYQKLAQETQKIVIRSFTPPSEILGTKNISKGSYKSSLKTNFRIFIILFLSDVYG
jgi:hypothetical protein